MISEPSIREILSLYRKHGWILRHVLLSEELTKALSGSIDRLFTGSEIMPSALDALWFSRSSRPGSVAWEIRHLSESPFALVETIGSDFTDEERDEALRSAEIKMAEIVKSKKPI